MDYGYPIFLGGGGDGGCHYSHPEMAFVKVLARGIRLVQIRSSCKSTITSMFPVSINVLHKKCQCLADFFKKTGLFFKKAGPFKE